MGSPSSSWLLWPQKVVDVQRHRAYDMPCTICFLSSDRKRDWPQEKTWLWSVFTRPLVYSKNVAAHQHYYDSFHSYSIHKGVWWVCLDETASYPSIVKCKWAWLTDHDMNIQSWSQGIYLLRAAKKHVLVAKQPAGDILVQNVARAVTPCWV